VAHACNLSYPSQKRAGGVVQGVGPEFKPQSEKIKRACARERERERERERDGV
jgi:hypothetical protein